MDITRDFVGYAGQPPKVVWPGGARLAVSIVINYEEGAEKSIALGDDEDEALGEWGGYSFPKGVRNVTMESITEYGSRVGVWRLLRILERHSVRATFFASAVALERNAAAAHAIIEGGHEVACHGYKWEDHVGLTHEEERSRIAVAVASMEATTGVRPYGWYGRNGLTPYTREALVDAGFLYDSNDYSEDLPYYVRVQDRAHLVVPYTADVNDVRWWTSPGFATTDQFVAYMKDTFDCLLAESETVSMFMSVGLHLRISGRPGRALALDRFLSYASQIPGVWFCRRDELARWWLAEAPPSVGNLLPIR